MMIASQQRSFFMKMFAAAHQKKVLASLMLAGLAMSASAFSYPIQNDGIENAADHVGAVLSHAAITAQVKTALVADSRTKAFDINVDTDGHGRVTLAGTAPSLEARRAATEVASHVNGVRSVSNRLMVTGDRTENPKTLSAQVQQVGQDGSLTAKVKVALADDKNVPSSDVSVDSNGTTVTLSGHVPSAQSRMATIERASQVPGVEHVEASNLMVDSQ
jgi:hyperosmotically inducible protein